MRTTTQIAAEIAKINAADRSYNNVINEGGEGYERDSVPQALRDEYSAAEQAEFAAAWTNDVTQQRRAAWNAAIAAIAAKYGERGMTAKRFADLQTSLGYKLADIRRATALHGI